MVQVGEGRALLAPVAALAGLVILVWRRRGPLDPRVQAAVVAGLAILAIVGAVVYRVQPPLLEGSSLAPLLAIIGGLVALVGAGRKAAAAWLTR